MPPWHPIQATCHPDRPHKALGLCRQCHSLRFKRQPHERVKNRKRAQTSAYRRRYGMTQDDYFRMLEEQGGGCKLCGKVPDKRRLCVDHNHTTGMIRGLLCVPCNHGLHFHENTEWANKATRYLLAAG